MDLRDVVVDARRREIRRPNDPWSGRDHLFGGEEPAGNEGADHRVADVEPFSGLLEGAPAIAFCTRWIEDGQVMRVAQRHDPRGSPRVATPGGVSEAIEHGRNLPIGEDAHQSPYNVDDVLARAKAMLALALLPHV